MNDDIADSSPSADTERLAHLEGLVQGAVNPINQDYIQAHGSEHERLAGLIRNDIKNIKDLVMLLIVVVFICLSIVTVMSVITARSV